MPVVSGQNPFAYALQGFIIGLFLLGFTSTVFAFERELWSTTDPQINLVHVFDGEINRKDKPTGFHHLSPRTDPARSRIKKVLAGPDKAGVYTALVEIFDRKRNQWKEKFSS
ncbi:EndoU domain-containing protein, partial [Sneathiella sp.]